jgi:hypothetical protein
MYVKSNTGNNANGHVQIKINGETVIDQSIRWTTNDSKRLISNLSFHRYISLNISFPSEIICLFLFYSFRGGSTDQWMSGTDGYIYYDNLFVRQISK